MIISLTIESKGGVTLSSTSVQGFDSEKLYSLMDDPTGLGGAAFFVYFDPTGIPTNYTVTETVAAIATMTAGGTATGTTNEKFAVDSDAADYFSIKNNAGVAEFYNDISDTVRAPIAALGATFTTTATTTTANTIDGDTVTTGIGLFGTFDGLTTGEGFSLTHTTSVIADGGSLLRLSSTGINTGGATTGSVLDISATAQLAGTIALITAAGLTTGNALEIEATAQTTGNLILCTGGAANMASGGSIASFDMGAATAGSGLEIVTSGDYVDLTDGMINVTANTATAGNLVVLNGTSLTTGAALSINAGTGVGVASTARLTVDMPVPAIGADIGVATAPSYWIPLGKRGVGGMTVTEFYIDLTGLSSVADDGDVIGDTGQTTSATLGQYTVAIMGTIATGGVIEMICLEAPQGGTADIDLYSHATGTLSIDDDASGGTQLITAGGDWTNGLIHGATADPTADHYFYLTAGAAAAGDYTHGKFLIRIYGA